MKTIFYRLPEPGEPGFILQGRMHNGNLQLETILPGARNPEPHRILNLKLQSSARANLIDILGDWT